MKLSTRSRFAVRALLDIAINYKGKPVQIKNIAKRQSLSGRYLENIFTPLRNAGILNSIKGKDGGFMLAKKPNEINILEIVQIMEGPISIVDCVGAPGSCRRSTLCVTRRIWDDLNKNIKDSLAVKNLDDLIKEFKKQIKNSKDPMYYI